MADMAAIAGLMSSLNAALNIGKAAMDLRDGAAVQSKIIDLNRQIFSALDSAIATKSEHLTMLDRIRELEQEIAKLRTWDGEKQRYELKDVYLGATAYALKPSDQSGEPPHWLCTACYSKAQKSILQPAKPSRSGRYWTCPACTNTIDVGSTVSPAHPFTPLFEGP